MFENKFSKSDKDRQCWWFPLCITLRLRCEMLQMLCRMHSPQRPLIYTETSLFFHLLCGTGVSRDVTCRCRRIEHGGDDATDSAQQGANQRRLPDHVRRYVTWCVRSGHVSLVHVCHVLGKVTCSAPRSTTVVCARMSHVSRTLGGWVSCVQARRMRRCVTCHVNLTCTGRSRASRSVSPGQQLIMSARCALKRWQHLGNVYSAQPR